MGEIDKAQPTTVADVHPGLPAFECQRQPSSGVGVLDNQAGSYLAKDLALRLETGITHDNLAQYRLDIKSVNSYAKSNPDKADAFVGAIETQLGKDGMSRSAILFHLYSISDGAGLSKLDITTARNTPSANLLEQNFLKAGESSYDQLPKRWFGSSAAVSGIKAEIEQSKINDLPRNNLRNFFAKEDGVSLYDRVKDKDGNIEYGAIDRMLQTDLTPLQRSVLEFMNDRQSHWTLDNLWNGRNMSKENLHQLARSYKMTVEEP